MRIVTLDPSDAVTVEQAARILHDAFRDLSPTWLTTIDRARAEVLSVLRLDGVGRALLDDDEMIGWGAAHHSYSALWELHPLAIAAPYRRRGYARMLVADLEQLAAARGALTMLVGVSDEADRTTLFGRDLYPDPLEHLAALRAIGPHALEVWQRLGYVVVGVVPDAEGIGQPTIHLAKRLR